MPLGKFVVIEGGDCCGKSTFVRHLKDIYPDFFYTNEPGGGSYGMKIRQLLLDADGAEESDNLTKFHLYWASKAENFAKIILPKLSMGIHVVSDRFEGSTFAYQVSENPKIEDLFWQTREVCLQRIRPIYINFDVSVETQIERAKLRSGESNYFDRRGIEYRKKVRAAYLRFFRDKRVNSHRVDAGLPKEEMLRQAKIVFDQIINL